MRITPKNIVAGVHNANSIAWLWEMKGTPLCQDAVGGEEALDDDCFSDQRQILYGEWSEKIGPIAPVSGDNFVAVYNPDVNTVQVLKSNYIIRCRPVARATQGRATRTLTDPSGLTACPQI